jgi:hypothetical protein
LHSFMMFIVQPSLMMLFIYYCKMFIAQTSLTIIFNYNCNMFIVTTFNIMTLSIMALRITI